MTPTITWSVVVLLFTARFISRRHWRAKLDHALMVQQFRDSFAQTRRDAIRLLYMGQLAPDSSTFRFLYMVSSFLARRAHAYPSFARSMFRELEESNYRSDSAQVASLQDEMATWTPDVREVFLDLNRKVLTLTLENYAPLRIVRALDRLHLLSFMEFVLKQSASTRAAKQVAEQSKRFEETARSPGGTALAA